MEQDEEISYSSYCDQLKQYREQCDSILDEVSSALTHSIFLLFQFFAWFNKVESQMEQDEEISYSSYCDQLKQYREQCDSVLDEVSTALSHLEELQKQYVFVSTKTNALHHACEESLQDQVCR